MGSGLWRAEGDLKSYVNFLHYFFEFLISDLTTHNSTWNYFLYRMLISQLVQFVAGVAINIFEVFTPPFKSPPSEISLLVTYARMSQKSQVPKSRNVAQQLQVYRLEYNLYRCYLMRFLFKFQAACWSRGSSFSPNYNFSVFKIYDLWKNANMALKLSKFIF